MEDNIEYKETLSSSEKRGTVPYFKDWSENIKDLLKDIRHSIESDPLG